MSILTIGNFDGCHLGHQDLLTKALSISQHLPSLPTIAISFAPRPEAFFKKLPMELLLTTVSQKSRIFREFGMSRFECLTFDASLAELSANDFCSKILVDTYKCKHLIIGEDFCFGKNREGNVLWLKQKASSHHFQLHIVPTRMIQEKKISSSAIRLLLAEHGDAQSVLKMLGRPYLVEGTLVKGAQLGRKIGFPTLNLKNNDQVLPRPGVYAGYFWVDLARQNSKHPSLLTIDRDAAPAVINIGFRPTVSSNQTLTVEAHLLPESSKEISVALSHTEGFYDANAGIYFLQRIREEKKFSDINELKQQISLDVQTAQETFKELQS